MQKVTLTINGVPQHVLATPEMVLLDLLREDLHLTGTKQSCDRKGQCGACTVLVNGKATLSCITKVTKLEGAEVITIEGLGTPINPHMIQEAFVLSGAVQCGFCIPGMIMATKGLLEKNRNPDDEAIKKALARNLCRCTGYTKIIDAVKLAGQFVRKETTPEEVRGKLDPTKMLGVSHVRPTSMIKACGVAKFGGDIYPKGALEIAVVRSTEFHANIKSIDTSAAEKMPGVAGIVRAADIKGTNRLRQVHPDQPVLCDDRVKILGDAIVIVAAETKEQADAAAKAVKVVYEPLPYVMEPEDALKPGAPVLHAHAPDNICARQPIIKGDAEKALAEAKYVVEANFTTQTNHQAPLEPESCVCWWEGEGEKEELVVAGRSINIHFHLNQLKEALGLQNMRYVEPFSGGQFGIKTWITSEAIAAAAAIHFHRPVRYIPSLEESILICNKRHAYHIYTKLCADNEGYITAMFCDWLMNKGAYTLNGPVLLGRSIMMLSGSYHIPNLKVLGRSVYTNNAYTGSARGAGPPQTTFSTEVAVEMLAEKMGIDPLEFRRKNSLKAGQTKATGMPVSEWSFVEVCDAIKPAYDRAVKSAQEWNAKNPGPVKRGVGIAAHSFGVGGAGDSAKLTIEVNPDDTFTLYAAIADPGEGNDAMIAQIMAHALGVPLEKIRLYLRDSDKTVLMGPAAGSRMTFMAGNAVLLAVEELKKAAAEAGGMTYEALTKAGKPTRYEGLQKNEGPAGLDKATGQGKAQVTECHNIQMAEVEVNSETGVTRVNKMTVCVDGGTVINRHAFEGQLEGGMDQGVGYALREEYTLGKEKDYVQFKFPTIRDSFEVETIIVETPRKIGPLGATGVGEMTMVSTAPAVINAIHNAVGAWVLDLPATPARVKAALAAKK
ncbi:MAG: molybdopterin-dependent oxidoreductase [Acidobacteriota bacterium]|jgi:aldehyde oxidoreductase|nr:molybdopterin-dependent oxidoreductase [Acidobacteriota bacterium]NLT33446.1 molybdopterin-dependent oxidoreductase [Acidobacteriota bacterium]